MKKILILALSSFALSINAQNVGIGTNNPDPSAKLDVQAVDGGILIPKIDIQSVTDATTIPTPATGLMIWNTAATFGTAGFYFNAGTSVLPNWVKVLDSASSLDDADANPSNEIQDLSLSGNTLSLSDDATTVDLTAFDGDIKSVIAGDGLIGGGTAGNVTVNVVATNGLIDGANNIKLGGALIENTTISQGGFTIDYTSSSTDGFSVDGTTFSVDAANNRIGIGTAGPSEKLSVFPNTDNSAEIGRAHIGSVGHSDWAAFSHVGINTIGGYALLQNSDGRTLLNSATGQVIEFRTDNTTQFEKEADGDLSMVLDNSIKMPNNMVYVEDESAQSVDAGSTNAWVTISSYTPWMDVESGNAIVVDCFTRYELVNGSGSDNAQFRIFVDGANGCPDANGNSTNQLEDWETFRGDYMPLSFKDVFPVSCNGEYRFVLQIYTGNSDDDLRVDDTVITAIKF